MLPKESPKKLENYSLTFVQIAKLFWDTKRRARKIDDTPLSEGISYTVFWPLFSLILPFFAKK